MNDSTWGISTWASVISAVVTIAGISVILLFEWYRRPRMGVRPSPDGPADPWIHLTVYGVGPRLWMFPRDIAIDCVERVSFLDPDTRQELAPQIEAHWVKQPEPRDYTTGATIPGLIPTATTRNIGFRDEMIDVLRRLPDGTTYVADPWYVYRWPPAAAPPEDHAEFERRRLKQREYIVRVDLEPANGRPATAGFRIELPQAGLGKVIWLPVSPALLEPFMWRLGITRLALKTLVLLLWPGRFARQAAEHAFRTELMTNEQLRRERPDGRMTYEDRERLIAQGEVAARALRRAILSSLGLIIVVMIAAWLTVLLLRRVYLDASPVTEILRVVSVGLIGWAVLGRLGWEIQTFNGRTLPEQINRFWWRGLYLLGLYLALVLIMPS